jgi:hypothetical protein
MQRPELVSYLNYSEINFGKTSTIAQFREELKKFPRNAIVRLCAAMNSVIATWVGDFNLDVQAKFVRSFFPGEMAEQIIALKRPVFHRQQLLFVIQEALQHCEKPDEPNLGPYVGGFGRVLLMASDHLHTPMPEGPAKTADKAAQVITSLLPTLEANLFTHYLNRVARSYLMLSRFIDPLQGEQVYFDVRNLFEQAAKVPLEIYLALVWASMSRFSKVEALRNTQDVSLLSVTPEWYGNTLPRNLIEAYLADISATADEFVTSLRKKNPTPSDFTILRDKPFVNENQRYFPIDFTFLSDKLESGVFWRVHNSLADRKEKDRFHVFWGMVFELYLNWLFDSCCNGKANEFLPNPRFSSNIEEQVCDGVILSGRAAILMEYKGSTFTAASKYGGGVDALRAEIESKLVGEPDRRKGVRQLAHAVERLCRREDPDSIDGIDMADVQVVLPVVITRDDIGSAWGTNAYLNARFQDLKAIKNQWRAVTSLFCLSANDVEMISPYLPDTRLLDILVARHKADKPLMLSFWTAGNRVIEKRDFRKPSFVYEQMKELTRIATNVLGLKPPP